jgi:hypothetical protein
MPGSTTPLDQDALVQARRHLADALSAIDRELGGPTRPAAG